MSLGSWRIKTPALSLWLRFFTGVVVALLVGGAILVETSRYKSAILSANERDETIVASLSQHAGDSFEMADLALVSISRLLGVEAWTRSQLSGLGTDMAEIVRRVPRIRSLFFYEEGGWQMATSQPNAVKVNDANSTFFRHHRTIDDDRLFIGKPFRNADDGAWLITASRRINKPDGSFGGVLAATIEASYFSTFYSSFSTGKDTRILLFANDGTLLARYPHSDYQIGRNFKINSFSANEKADETSGTRRIISPIDGTDRLCSFHKLGRLPLTMVYSVPFAEVIKEWRQALFVRVPLVLALAGFLIIVGLRLAANARTYQVSEINLFKLARTDALTGLLNRRSFDESIQFAWRRCVAADKPLSILMIDVDCFKAFNDAHGHLAGDLCLQIVATAVQQSVHFPDDLVVRYGGEEIAVILPDTASERAFLVAERIRVAILDLNVPHVNSAVSNRLTVSIGCSTVLGSTSSAEPVDLLLDADRSLYKAKAGGRNRVVASMLETSYPTEALRWTSVGAAA